MARITRKSMLTNIVRTMEIPEYDQNEFDNRIIAWENHECLIQEAFPNISLTVREFIMTGITDDEWNKEFGEQ